MVEEKKKIDKKFLPTIYAFIVLIILGGLYFLMLSPSENTVVPIKENFLFDFPSDQVNYISIKDKIDASINCELRLNKAGNWEINNSEAFNQGVINIIGLLKNVKVLSHLSDYSNLNQFGLNPPDKILTLAFKDTKIKPVMLLIGSYTPTRSSRYVKFPDKNDVLIVENNLYNSLSVNPQGLLDRDMFKIQPENMISFTIKSKKKVIQAFLQDNKWLVDLNNSQKFYADEDKIGFIVSNFFGNAANAVFNTNNFDKAKMYLNPPLFTLIVKDNKGNVASVDISHTIPGTKLHYAVNFNTKKVYLVDEEKVKSLIFEDLEIKNKKVILPQLTDIQKIILKLSNGKSIQFVRTNINTWQASGDTYLQDTESTKYIEKLASMKYDYVTFIDPKSTKEPKSYKQQVKLLLPEIELEIYQKNNKNNLPIVIKIGNAANDTLHYSENSYEVYLNCLSDEKYNELISIFKK